MIESWNKRRDELLFKARAANAAVTKETEALAEAREEEATIIEAKDVLQTVGQEVQQQAHAKIAGVVTHCLQAVFGRQFRFEIRFERKAGRTQAALVLLKKDVEVDPMFGSGGGVVDVAAFALRVACLCMTKPPLRKLLVVDEPFRNIHGEANRLRAKELIESTASELGVQIVMCTGLEWLRCGKIVEV